MTTPTGTIPVAAIREKERTTCPTPIPQRRGMLELVALRDIVPGEEVEISYIDLDDFPKGSPGSKERQSVLLAKYRFLCQCPHCTRL